MDLLAPAGNYQKFIAGLTAGADAFYLGLQKFSARSSAGNFSPEELHKAFLAARLHNKKIYLAINTLLMEKELPEVISTLSEVAPYRPAGIIIQDLALVKIIKENFPELPLVASTQLSVHNLNGVRFLEKLGFDQAVLARELSLDEIKHIKQNSNIKLEIFLHGAMCFSYSGQCLFSSFIGGRSGNRGECAQICRKKFSLDNQAAGCLLSPKDLDGTAAIAELARIGVSSLKIEGRMRSPQYVYAAIRYYRGLLNGLPAEEIERRRYSLQIAFDRGSSSGYFYGKNDNLVDKEKSANRGLYLGRVQEITATTVTIERTAGYQLQQGDGLAVTTAGRTFGFLLKEPPVNQSGEIMISEQIGQFKKTSEIYVTSQAALQFLDTAEPKIPLDIAISSSDKQLIAALPQNGDSFVLPLETARSEQDFNAFLLKKISNFSHPVFALNIRKLQVAAGLFLPYARLREELNSRLDQLTGKIPEQTEVQIPPDVAKHNYRPVSKPVTVFIVDNPAQLELCRAQQSEICLTFAFYSQSDKKMFEKGSYRLLLPPLIKDKYSEQLDSLPENILPVVSNPGELSYFISRNRPAAASWHINISNSIAAEVLFEQGIRECMLSLETDLTGFNFRPAREYSLLVFGELPVMTTEYCLIKNNAGCSRCKDEHQLTDEKGAVYSLKSNSFCQNEIFFHTPLNLAKESAVFKQYPFSYVYVNLTGLSNQNAEKTVNYYNDQNSRSTGKNYSGRYILNP